ncbi:hypothetical protein [Bdellovibrio sp. HCB337]|uniref:hypothetical protein n=1 Tax=Bdellovibrio sp. HCB337 TaxID=3394358 RepID=UPI0039A552EE
MKKQIAFLAISFLSLSAMASTQVTQYYSCSEKNGSSSLEIQMYLAEPAYVSSIVVQSSEFGNCEAAVGYDARIIATSGSLYDIEINKHSISGDCYYSRTGDAAISWKGAMTTKKNKVITFDKDGSRRTFNCQLDIHDVSQWQ